jgi:glycosyltransferase involved in cell wall biosynthesis
MSTPISVGLYFDSRPLGNWNWNTFIASEIGMSGSDSQMLWLSYHLSRQPDYRFQLFTNIAVAPYDGINVQQVADAVTAVRQAHKEGCSILILNGRHGPDTIQALAAAESFGIKLIVWAHNPPHPQLQELYTKLCAVKRVVAVSRNQYHHCRHFSWFPKLCVVSNGVEIPMSLTEQALDNGKPVIGWLGATNESKGFHWMCMAWPAIRKQFPNAVLKVMGSVRLHDCNREVGESGIAERSFEQKYIHPWLGATEMERKKNGVSLLGKLNPAQLALEIPACDLGVVNPNLPPHHETFCISALDFQRYAVPVIGAKAGGLLETVANGKTGMLVERPDQLAGTVIGLLRKPERIARMRRQCLPFVSGHFAMEHMATEAMRVIREVALDRPAAILPLETNGLSIRILAKELLRLWRIVSRARVSA